jgi:hypothetical protein
MIFCTARRRAMEDTKLTIRVPQAVLEEAKRYARRHETSITRLVSEYLRRLGADEDPLGTAPIVRRLSGILSPQVTVADYRAYLEEKYGGETPSSV